MDHTKVSREDLDQMCNDFRNLAQQFFRERDFLPSFYDDASNTLTNWMEELVVDEFDIV